MAEVTSKVFRRLTSRFLVPTLFRDMPPAAIASGSRQAHHLSPPAAPSKFTINFVVVIDAARSLTKTSMSFTPRRHQSIRPSRGAHPPVGDVGLPVACALHDVAAIPSSPDTLSSVPDHACPAPRTGLRCTLRVAHGNSQQHDALGPGSVADSLSLQRRAAGFLASP